jgi:methionyl-tRNA formyltransferase
LIDVRKSPDAPIRIVFAGTPEFAVPTLRRLHARGADLRLVLTQPDRPAGRGRKSAGSPVKRAAEALGLTVAQPSALRDPGLLSSFGAAPDVVVVVAYGQLFPGWMLAWPGVACINLHASLLPRWRGAAPIQYAILAGDAETGVSVMRMEAGLDRGPVYATAAVAVEPDESAGQLHERLAVLGADLLADVLPRIREGGLKPTPQDDSRASYAPKVGKSDARLDWELAADRLARQVRAYNPWPVAETRMADGRRLRVWRARALPAAAPGQPGTVIRAGPAGIDVATGDGLLRLEQVQPASSKVMDAGAYLAAHRLDGVRFER